MPDYRGYVIGRDGR